MGDLSRREWLGLAGLAAAPLVAGCSGAKSVRRFPLHPEEQIRLDEPRVDFAIVVRGGPDQRVLRQRAREVSADLDLGRIDRRMEASMRQAQGVGIAGPQVGLSLRLAVLELDYKTDHPRTVFACNPLILERSDDCLEGYEGCLSVPDVGGLVRRNRWIRVRYEDPIGAERTVEAEGPNAVLWQHELDHLDGVLYIDRLLGELLPMEEVRRRRRELEQRSPAAIEDVSLHPEPIEGSLFVLA